MHDGLDDVVREKLGKVTNCTQLILALRELAVSGMPARGCVELVRFLMLAFPLGRLHVCKDIASYIDLETFGVADEAAVNRGIAFLISGESIVENLSVRRTGP